MKQWIISLFMISLCVLPHSVCAENTGEHEDGFHLHEAGIGMGYGWGDLKRNQGDYDVLPLFLHFGFDINSLVGLDDHAGTLQFAVEPFANYIVNPDGGGEVGVDLFLKYSYPVFDEVSLYAELGAGPMYFSIDTVEQGDAGFNFLDQFGGGMQWFFAEDKSFNLGYRWRHISNAGLGNDPNTGINAHSVVFGMSAYY